jgi:hypothetical protein
LDSTLVLPEKRRMFCRGREWDGYPSGTVEIEGATWIRMQKGTLRLQAANRGTFTV